MLISSGRGNIEFQKSVGLVLPGKGWGWGLYMQQELHFDTDGSSI